MVTPASSAVGSSTHYERRRNSRRHAAQQQTNVDEVMQNLQARLGDLQRDLGDGAQPKTDAVSEARRRAYIALSNADLKLEIRRLGLDCIFCFSHEDLVDRLLQAESKPSAAVATPPPRVPLVPASGGGDGMLLW
eukprot:NODE_23625_length_658_cov_2.135593.p3 GENE.NODE_23625_length_658_cov_2.135593~~NODE_23625_length_658_cov_2.135593.p3  ORF type:complete len:135 (+),score=51.88 NODE_23625_length_658_cov_2.135593:127-531(+)